MTIITIKKHPLLLRCFEKKVFYVHDKIMRKFEKSCKEKLKSTSTDSEAKEKQGLYINLKNTSMEKSIYIYYCYIIV